MTHCICSKMIAKSIHSSTADWTDVDVEEEADPDDAPFLVPPIPVPVAPVPVPDLVLISDPDADPADGDPVAISVPDGDPPTADPVAIPVPNPWVAYISITLTSASLVDSAEVTSSSHFSVACWPNVAVSSAWCLPSCVDISRAS